MAATWCTLVNEDLLAMDRPPIEMVEIRTHRREISAPGSNRRYVDIDLAKEQSRYVFCDKSLPYW